MKRLVAVLLAAAGWARGAAAYDWTQFNGDAQHSGNNASETTIDASNVASLVPVFQATLPAVCDGAPLIVQRVGTPAGTRDLLFATTRPGDLVAIDARTGATVWSRSNPAGTCRINGGTNVCYTTSSPAVSPDRVFVFAYGLDGKVHRYRTADGTEVVGQGWPQTATLKGLNEKGSSNLSVAINALGTPFLYVCNGGYPGDRGDYQGHVTAVNLSTQAQIVFNAACSDVAAHFVQQPGTPDCAHVQTAIWARSGAVYDPVTNRLFVATGNGDYDAAAAWGDSVLAIHPNATTASGKPIDSYTPANFQDLQDADLDLGSTAPAILPAPAYAGRLGVQSGKDGMLRLIRLDDLSGHGAPGFTGGAVQMLPVPQGGAVFSAPAVWVNPADGATWMFVGNGAGLSALKLSASGANASLSVMWTKSGASFSPLVADGILYAATGGLLRALAPTTGDPLWSTTAVGGIHWQSPVVANGILYLADEAGKLSAWAPAFFPVRPEADAEAVSGGSSNANGVIEPGETAELSPFWKNDLSTPAALTGTLNAFSGPSGASYSIGDSAADYGTIAAGATATCRGSSAGCYRIAISSPATRPAAHWDATASETLSTGAVRKWRIHVGRSFADVPSSEAFFAPIETLLHTGVTTGCGAGTYCPSQNVTRRQIAAFVARAALGRDGAVPIAGSVPGLGAYACRAGGVSLFSDVAPASQFCPQIHGLAAGGRSFSCSEQQPAYASTWCPDAPLTRGEFAAILARDLAGSDAAVPGKRADPGNGRGYDCTDGKANVFTDVPDDSPFCRFVYYIWSRGIVDGFGDGTYRPDGSVPRDQMAKFLVNAYALTLD